jgi:type IV pilus assembly protein PilQ
LTGVISDEDRSVVAKWPILGDMPLIGQFFRSTTTTRQKRELVIMVTPRIINDDNGGEYGYGYRPETQAARSMVYSTN